MIRHSAVEMASRAWAWFLAGFAVHPTASDNAPSVRWSLLAFRWGLTATYVCVSLIIGLGQTPEWVIGTIGYLLIYHLATTLHTSVHMRRGRPVMWFWELIPFADIVAVSLILASASSVTFPIWVVYAFIIFGASISRGNSYVLTLTGACMAGYAAAVGSHLATAQPVPWPEVIVIAIMMTLGGWLATIRASFEHTLYQDLNESEERYRDLYEDAPNAYFSVGVDACIRTANRAAEELLGYTTDELVGKPVFDLYADTPTGKAKAREVFSRFVAGAETSGEELEMQRSDGRHVWGNLSVRALRDAEGQIVESRSIVVDITERKQAEEALRESERLLLESQSVAQVGSYVLDIPSGVWESSPVLDRIFGIGEDYERSVESWLALVHPDDRQSMNDHFAHDVVEEHGRFDREYRVVRHDDGTERWVLGLGKLEFDARGQPLRMVGTIQDITERKRAEETIRHLAYHDALTGLPNRTLFEDRLTVALAQAHRKEQFVAVMFLDLDRFKIVNDTAGHTFGDQLLQDVAERLTGLVREGDTVARMGGDEFTVLLPEVAQAADAVEIAERILETLRRPWRIDNREYHVTASIGIAIYPSDGEDAESLIRNADTAMYRAKEQGRDNFELFTAAMNANMVERLALENSLRRGLERDEFVVHYQPQVSIRSGRIVGNEALVRWQHPERGLVSPMEFIPVAEETSLIVPLGAWVLQAACTQNVAWQQAGHSPMPVAVNLSARQFQQRDLLDTVKQVLEESGMDPQYLILEITEGAAMHDAESTATTLRALREMGIQIAIDDFGTGHSSLSYLKRFPVSALKIDRSFVRDLTIDPEDAAITAAIIAMAKSLKLKVIAEGVELEEQLAFLKEHGCDEMQGFLFSKPVPATALEKMLTRDSRPRTLVPRSG